MSAVENHCSDCGARLPRGQGLCAGCGAGQASAEPPQDEKIEMSPSSLTARDYSVIERILVRRAADDPWLALIARAKLASARLVPASAGAASVGSRVVFRIEGGVLQQRTLTDADRRDGNTSSAELAVATPLGLALLGMKPGDLAVLPGRDGVRRRAWIETVESPSAESADLSRTRPRAMAAAPAPKVVPLRPRANRGPGKDWPSGPGSPGPSAA